MNQKNHKIHGVVTSNPLDNRFKYENQPVLFRTKNSGTSVYNARTSKNRKNRMHPVSIIVISVLLIALTGCVSKDQFYRGMYEGLKTRETNVHPQIDQHPVPQAVMPYEEYEAERQKLQDNK